MISFHMLFGHLKIFFCEMPSKIALPFFKWPFFNWLVGITSVFWMWVFCQVYVLQISSPRQGTVFILLMLSVNKQKLLILIMSILSFFFILWPVILVSNLRNLCSKVKKKFSCFLLDALLSKIAYNFPSHLCWAIHT